MQLILQLILTLSVISPTLTRAADFKLLSLCDQYLNQVEKTLVDPTLSWDHPEKFLQQTFRKQADTLELQKFEDDVVSMFIETPPAARDWASFGERWNLSENEVLNIQSYYGLSFFDFPGIIGDRSLLAAQVQASAPVPSNRFISNSQAAEQIARRIAENDSAILRLHRAIVEQGGIPTTTVDKITKKSPLDLAIGVSALKFCGIGVYAENKGQRHLRLNSSRRQATERALARVSSNSELNAREKNTVEKILQEEVDRLKFDTLSVSLTEQNEIVIRKFHNAILNLGAIPSSMVDISTGKIPFDLALGISHFRFCGTGIYGDAYPSSRLRLNSSRLEAMEQSLARVDTNEDLTTDEKIFVAQILQDEVDKLKPEETSLAEQNKTAIDRLHRAIADQGEIPSTTINRTTSKSPFESVLGVTASRFCGTGDYADGKGLKVMRLNSSRLEAMERALARVDRDKDLNADEKTLVGQILQDEVDQLKFDNLSATQQNQIVIDRLQLAIAEQGKIPTSTFDQSMGKSPLEAALGIGFAKFFGTGNYADDKPSARFRLNSSRLEAMKRTFARVDSNSELNDEQKILVKEFLQKEISKLKAKP